MWGFSGILPQYLGYTAILHDNNIVGHKKNRGVVKEMGKDKWRRRVDVDEISTWTKHTQRLCSKCRANCCTMPVEVKIPDLVRIGVITEFEADEPIKKIAKKLKKDGVIEHFYYKEQIFILVRFANKDCLYLDPTRRKCKIYKDRPDTCREHPRIGSRPGFCAYEPK